MPDSLKELGSKAFAMCDRLEYINMPSNLEKLGADVLYQSACYYRNYNWDGDVFYIGSCLMDAKYNISGSCEVKPYITHIADDAFYDCEELTEIILPEDLKIIGAGAFKQCENLQRVVFPSGITTIAEEAFYACENLRDIRLPASVTHIGQSAFGETAFYKDKENWENGVLYAGSCLVECNSSVAGVLQVRPGTKTIVMGAMRDRTKITELTLPDTVTTISEKAFYGCTALKTVYLGKGVSQIGAAAFGQCHNLENIVVHSENKIYRTKNNCLIQDKTLILGHKASQIPQDGTVTHIGAFAFEGCSGLTEITIPDTITNIEEGAFRYCDHLTSVKLGNGVQVVEKRAFEHCYALSQIDLGKSVHTIEDYGFAYNQRITQVTFPASLRYLGKEVFSNDTAITSLNFSEGLLSIGEGCFYFCENLLGAHLPDSLKKIESSAFYGCEKIATLELGEGLTTIGDVAFSGCEALESLDVPDRVQTIGASAFEDCTNLRWVNLGKVEKIGDWAFTSCKSLTQIHIPATLTEIGQGVFSYCTSIEKMTVSPENTYYHSSGNCIIDTDGKYVASGCKNSVIPDDGSVVALDGYSFAGCAGLKSIVVPDQVQRICRFTFLDCSGLEFIQLPFIGGVNDPYGGSFGYIFGGLTGADNDQYVPDSLKRVVITGGTVVGSSAFVWCAGLQEIVLPETITKIDYRAFAYCGQLQRVILPGNLEKLVSQELFNQSPNAKLYISADQDNTKMLVESGNIPYELGGVITFRDDQGRLVEQTWYPLNGEITVPELPQKPSDDRYDYEATWSPVPDYCTGNATIQLRYIAHRVNGVAKGDLTGDGKINSLDGLLLMRYLNGWDVDTASPDAMDVNGNGKVDSLDGLILMRYLNGWNVNLG